MFAWSGLPVGCPVPKAWASSNGITWASPWMGLSLSLPRFWVHEFWLIWGSVRALWVASALLPVNRNAAVAAHQGL